MFLTGVSTASSKTDCSVWGKPSRPRSKLGIYLVADYNFLLGQSFAGAPRQGIEGFRPLPLTPPDEAAAHCFF